MKTKLEKFRKQAGSVRKAAEKLKISERTYFRYLEQGKAPACIILLIEMQLKGEKLQEH